LPHEAHKAQKIFTLESNTAGLTPFIYIFVYLERGKHAILRTGQEASMSGTKIIQEYEDHLRRSGIYGGFAVFLFILSIIGLTAFVTYREELEIWGELLLPAGLILLVLALSLAILSLITLRCLNCYRILGGIRAAAYCPSCGTRLMEVDSRGLESYPGDELAEEVEDFPEETYPKDIRMFTTLDETELTKRFIRLIRKDEKAAFDDEEGTELASDENGEEADGDDGSEDNGENIGEDIDSKESGEVSETDDADEESGGYQKPEWRIEHERTQTNPEDIIFSFLGAIFRFGRH
jgi:hypothetical protein